MKKRVPRAGPQAGQQRKARRRPMPRWLNQSQELNTIARSRCLLILSVLSGEMPVTEAIKDAQITRQTYYNLETRALQAMLAALNPLASTADDGSPNLSAAMRRIAELEARVKGLEQEKRRAERMLLLTRKSIRFAVVQPRRGRPPKDRGWIPSGKSPSLRLKAKAAASGASIPTLAGAAAS